VTPKVDPGDRRALLQQALTAVDEMRAKLEAQDRSRREPVAIVGMGCRFPGGVEDPDGLWRLVRDGVDAAVGPPPGRPDAAGGSAHGGFLSTIDQFEPEFFGISPREAATLDPQQRLLLETAWEALERAGQAPDALSGAPVGVFIGITTSDYARVIGLGDGASTDVYAATGNALNAAAGRLSFVLGLQGPCVAVDTACSSSLVALHLAVQSLRAGESEMALAGGVNVILRPDLATLFASWGMLAADGRCKTFDAAADGFVRSEGCGVLVLKRLSDAVRHSDPVLAVIRGTAVNQDGRSSGLTVPNGPAQQRVIRRALETAGVEPAAVHYVEAHGTGTPIGDPIEVEALAAVLGKDRPADDPLLLGSIKTNIGHTEAASGVAGVMKSVLALQHEEIPPHLHLQRLNPRVPWDRYPLRVPTARTPWPAGDRPRIAGVSAFGFSGTNAHVVLEEAPEPAAPAGSPLERPHHLLVLSARTEPALRQLAGRMAAYLAEAPERPLADVCFTAATGRAHLPHRLACAAATGEDAIARLRRVATGEARAAAAGLVRPGHPAKVAWMFTGQGSQYAGMARRLYETQPAFRATLDRCDVLLRPHVDQPLTAVLFPDAAGAAAINQTGWTQPALFAVEYALAMLWREWGVEPAAVFGHSVGEYVAAAVAGVFSLEDALTLIAARGRLMQALSAGGAMAAVFAPEADVARVLAPYADRASIAAVNAPGETVISGEAGAVDAIRSRLEAAKVRTKPLVVSHAFHSPLMEPMLDEFEQVARRVTARAPNLPIVSNVTGGYLPAGATLDAAYWRRHIRQPVRFLESVRAVLGRGVTTFLEIGPAPILSGLIRQAAPAPDVRVLASLRRNRDEWATMLDALGGLYVAGVPIDWAGVDRPYARRRVALPTYPFQRRRCWVETPSPHGAARSRAQPGGHPLLGTRMEIAAPSAPFVWENELSLERVPFLADHRVQGTPVVPATAFVEMVMAAATEVWGEGPLALSGIAFHRPLPLTSGRAAITQVVLTPQTDGAATFDVFSRSTGGGSWSRHASGRIRRHTGGEESGQSWEGLAEVRARCAETVDGARYYRSLAERGNTWGPAFQGLTQVARRDGEAVSDVRIPDALRAETPRYLFHPAVSDACGHVLMATIPVSGSADSPSGAFVGGALDEVRFYRRPRSGALVSYARLRQRGDDGSRVLVGDVRVFDESGALVSETIGARLRRVDSVGAGPAHAEIGRVLYRVAWERIDRPRDPEPPKRLAGPGIWLVFCDDRGAGDAVASALAGRGESVLRVRRGTQYRCEAGQPARVRPGQAGDVRTLVDGITERGETIRGVVYLWSLDQPPAEELSAERIDAVCADCCATALHIVQAFPPGVPGPSPRLWLVTRGAQRIAAEPACDVTQATLWGFGRSLSAERSALWGGLVDLDPAESPALLAEQLADELLHPTADDQIAMRRDGRYGPRLVRWTPPAGVPSSVTWRADASYLITGGFGALGLEVARWMARGGVSHLVLIGRTAPPPRSEWSRVDPASRAGRQVAAVQALEALGISVRAAAVDVADAAQLEALVADLAREGRPPIRGVIHTAGVVQSSGELDTAALRDVMRPKVVGAWAIHEVLGDQLDLFVLFSSAAAVLSWPLIGGYAAANAGLDALAQHRAATGRPATSINWGLWGEVGMGAEAFADRRPAAGAPSQALTPAEALAALDVLCAARPAQAAVLPIDWAAWAQAYPSAAEAPLLRPLMQEVARPATGSLAVSREAFQHAALEMREELAREYLASRIEAVVGISRADLDMDLPLTMAGIDSLMAVELRNRFEAELGVDLPAVRLLEGPSVRALAVLLAAAAGDVPRPGRPPRSIARPEDVEGLSDAEVDAMLETMLESEAGGEG
jgi:acyl transferase domain-containing protein/acyl carrier protein